MIVWIALTTGLDSTKLVNMMKIEQKWGTSLKTTKKQRQSNAMHGPWMDLVYKKGKRKK